MQQVMMVVNKKAEWLGQHSVRDVRSTPWLDRYPAYNASRPNQLERRCGEKSERLKCCDRTHNIQ